MENLVLDQESFGVSIMYPFTLAWSLMVVISERDNITNPYSVIQNNNI